MPSIDVSFLPFEKINCYAQDFLNQYNPNKTIPVPIDEIIEFQLGIDIAPFPQLQPVFDTDGFLSNDCSCIYVDEFVYKNRAYRYRYTLAHEIGHFIMHRENLHRFRPKSIKDYKDFYMSIDEKDYSWIETQAYIFGGLCLVPRGNLLLEYNKQISLFQSKIDSVKKDVPGDLLKDYVVNAVSTNLSNVFDVSTDVLNRRNLKELEKGFLKMPT